MSAVTGKVARTLSKTVLVLNIGTDDGVREGMEFVIFEEGDEIVDPETKESLGKLEIVKGNVIVVSVQPRISIAETATRVVQRERWIEPSFAWQLNPFAPRREVEEVKVKDQLQIEVKDDTYSNRLVVRAGDLVRSTT